MPVIDSYPNATPGATAEFVYQENGATKNATQNDISAAIGVQNGTVSLKNIGAVGDGITDDRAALNTANGMAQEKVLPPGTYLVASSLVLSGVWRFAAGAILKPANGVTITLSATATVYASDEWRDISAGGLFTYSAGSAIISVVDGKTSHTKNITFGHAGNLIASDVGTSSILGGGNTGNENFIGYTEYRDLITGDAVTTQWTTTFAATPGTMFVQLIRADKVRVTVTTECDFVQNGANIDVTYPKPGHFVNDGTGGSEGTNAAVLATQRLVLASTVKTTNPGSLCDYSCIVDGYDNVIQSGVRQSCSGAHHRIVGGDHNTIFGGSYNRISAGLYGGIFGGTSNEIGASGSGSFVTGFGNQTSGTGPSVAIGSAHTVSSAFGAALGGSGNTVNGNGASVLGRDNTASGVDSFAGGKENTASGAYAVVLGFQGTVSGAYSFAVGRQNTASGESSAATGRDNTASGNNSRVSGRHGVATHACSDVIGGERFAASGDAQTGVRVGKRTTTDATPTEIRIGDATARFTIPNNTTWGFKALIAARRVDVVGESAFYEINGCIDHNAGTVGLVGSPAVTTHAEDTVAWSVSAGADNTNKALSLTVTGEGGKTIRWVARLVLVEVGG